MPRPKKSWSNSTAKAVPSTTVMISTWPTRRMVLTIAARSAGSVIRKRIVLQSGEAGHERVEKIVALQREPDGHRERHDHPDQEEADRRGEQRRSPDGAPALPGRAGTGWFDGGGGGHGGGPGIGAADGRWRSPAGESRRGSRAPLRTRRPEPQVPAGTPGKQAEESYLMYPAWVIVRTVAASAASSAASIVDCPPSAAATCCPTCVPIPWNSGMATNWTPV